MESSIRDSIVISAGMTEGCFDMELVDDNIHEPREDFQITARLPGSTTPDAITTVFIDDDEGELGAL